MTWRKVNADIAQREKQEQAEAETAEEQIQLLLAAREATRHTS